MKKITVIGDIMCEPPFFVQSKTETGYDFHFAFEPLRGLLSEADLVIGNLETPLAGEEAGYTDELVSFNAPDALADALKDAGVDVLITANNHCLDRGLDGLRRTLLALDEKGIPHTGTYADPAQGGTPLYLTVGDTKLALLAYTYGTNAGINRCIPEKEQLPMVNLLRPIEAPSLAPAMPAFYQPCCDYVESLLGRPLKWIEKVELRKSLGIRIAYCDDRFTPPERDEYMEAVERDIREAKKQADIVLICPHTGGQFGTTPGKYSLYVIERMKQAGASAILAAHSHTTLRAEHTDGVPCFYSLGNVSMFPNTAYAVMESLPQYGIAAHLYTENGTIEKTTFSLFKILASGEEKLRVVPVDELAKTLEGEALTALEADVGAVVERITGKAPEAAGILREYPLG